MLATINIFHFSVILIKRTCWDCWLSLNHCPKTSQQLPLWNCSQNSSKTAWQRENPQITFWVVTISKLFVRSPSLFNLLLSMFNPSNLNAVDHSTLQCPMVKFWTLLFSSFSCICLLSVHLDILSRYVCELIDDLHPHNRLHVPKDRSLLFKRAMFQSGKPFSRYLKVFRST